MEENIFVGDYIRYKPTGKILRVKEIYAGNCKGIFNLAGGKMKQARAILIVEGDSGHYPVGNDIEKIEEEEKMNGQSEYFIEKCAEEDFNLWLKEDKIYYAMAGLSLGALWKAKKAANALSYDRIDIKDELESPLIKISQDCAEKILSMIGGSSEKVSDYVELSIHSL